MEDDVRLTWPEKGTRAIYDPSAREWRLCDREPLPCCEMEGQAFGEDIGRSFDPRAGNLLIHGENLSALSELGKGLQKQVRLVYIDPPYNTGQEFEHYSDRGSQRVWLTMMQERLELLRDLLADDGSIYVQLDWNMAHYCKVLMDEVFGKSCFQREIIWRIGWVSGYKTQVRNYVRNHDTILFYTRDPHDFVFNKAVIPYAPGYRRRDGSLPRGKGLPLEDTWNCSEGDRLDSIQIMSFSGEKVGFTTQKNEDLLARIITASSNPGDLVLDCFAGSGTTGAAAHKLGRRWIMIEAGDQALSFCLPRMQRVVSGEDQSGISRKVGWLGGGGFQLWELRTP